MTKPSVGSRRRLRSGSVVTTTQQRRRRLVEYTHCDYRRRHCDGPLEHNVFSLFDGDGQQQEEPNDDDPQTTTTPTEPVISNDDSATPAPVEESSSCVADEFGNYGSNGSEPGTVLQLVAFDYQVQTPREYTVQDLNGGLLAIVEKRLAQFVAEALLDICQSAKENNVAVPTNSTIIKETATTLKVVSFNIFQYQHRSLQKEEDHDELPLKNSLLTGLQVLPPEFVRRGRKGVQCQTPLVEGADRCFTVLGAYTLVGQGGDTLDWVLPQAIDVTRLTMNQGKLNDAHEGIVDVTFLGQLSDDEYRAEFEDPSTLPPPIVASRGSDSDTKKLENWHWILVGFGAALLMLIVTALVLRRRSRPDEREYDRPAATIVEQDEGRSDDSATRLIDTSTYQQLKPPSSTSRMAVLAAAIEDEAKENSRAAEGSEAAGDMLLIEEPNKAKVFSDTGADSGESSGEKYEDSDDETSEEAIYGGDFHSFV